jgi:curved DNA-binding protein CbpA
MTYDPLGYYQCLNADYNTDEKNLKINYREQAKFWHPDHNKSENALEEFQKISIAYDVLKDIKTRTVYNLLALAYDASNFPDMKTLKLYKAANGDENPFLRVFNLQKVIWRKRPEIQEEKLIGTFADAQKFISETTRHNWLKGWWSPKAAALTVKALKNNFYGIGKNSADNFKMLVHNTAAFYDLGKVDKAKLSAIQALEYAKPEQKEFLLRFTELLPPVNTIIPQWDYSRLKKIQLKIPLAIAAAGTLAAIALITPLLMQLLPESAEKTDKIDYYQQVKFNSGAKTVDDVVVSKIFNIPVDTSDTKMLYHLKYEAKIMYGPSDEFDVLTTGKRGQTVRVTGYTPDEEWFRVMLDNGEMGFITKQNLKKGIGTEIPAGSKIFNANTER